MTLSLPMAAHAQTHEATVTFADGHVEEGPISFRYGYHTGSDGMRHYKDPTDEILFAAEGANSISPVSLDRIRTIELEYDGGLNARGTVTTYMRRVTITTREGAVVTGLLPAIDAGFSSSHTDFTTHLLLESQPLVVNAFELPYFSSQYVPYPDDSAIPVKIELR